MQQRVQQELWENLNIGTTFLPGQEWPEEFFEDIVEGLVTAKSEAEDALRGLRTSENLSLEQKVRYAPESRSEATRY